MLWISKRQLILDGWGYREEDKDKDKDKDKDSAINVELRINDRWSR